MSKATPSGQESADVSSPSIKDAEHFEYSVPAGGIAVVANVRHDDPAEHTYAVNVAESGETVACSCPADEYHPGECKHRQAVENTECVVLAASATDTERRA
jgi:hypothetical protein